MSLLDKVFGTADQTAALGLLGARMMSGDTARGFGEASGLLYSADDRKLKRSLLEAQIAETMAQADERKTIAAQRQAEAARQAGIQAGLPGLFQRPGLTGGEARPQAFAGTDVPMFSAPMGVAPMRATPGGFDMQRALTELRMKPEEAKAYAEAAQFGRPKVARTVEVDDGRGGKATMQLDEYGQPVGSSLPGYVAPVQVDRGGGFEFVKPVAGLNVSKTGNPFSDLLVSDGQGGVRQNSPLIAAKRSIAAAGASTFNMDSLGLKPKDRFEMEDKLRADYIKATGTDQAIVGTAADIANILQQPGSLKDQAAIYKFAKALDPDGAVREADYAAIVKTAGGTEYLLTLANKALTGEQLSPKQRTEMASVTAAMAKVAQQRIARQQATYAQRAKMYNLTPENVFAAPPAGPPQKTVKRTGKAPDGRKVVEYSDGSIDYAD